MVVLQVSATERPVRTADTTLEIANFPLGL
jgi:hypothetical protein